MKMRRRTVHCLILLSTFALIMFYILWIVKERRQEAEAANILRQAQERAMVQSNMEPETCYLCGRNPRGLMGYYRKLNSVGILFLNDWNITDVQAIALSDRGKEIPCDGRSSTIFNTYGIGNGAVMVNSQKSRGISRVELSIGEENVLDLGRAAEKLCQPCLNRVTDCFPESNVGAMEQNHDVFILNFLSGQLYALKPGSTFVTGDYYIEVRAVNDGMKLLVVYTPEREVKELTVKDFKKRMFQN